MKPVYIYGLKDPRTGEIRYVGKSDKPKARYNQHIKGEFQNGHKERWIAELKRENLRPEMVILEVTDEKGWEMREKYWIKFGLDSNWPLTNIAAGGACHPNPIQRYDWSTMLDRFLLPDERTAYRTLAEETQQAICGAVASKMIDYSITGIRRRGGNEKEFDPYRPFREGEKFARQLLSEAD